MKPTKVILMLIISISLMLSSVPAVFADAEQEEIKDGDNQHYPVNIIDEKTPEQSLPQFESGVLVPGKSVYDETDSGFAYTVNESGTITITGYTEYETRISIPGEIENLPVTIIGPAAFSGMDKLYSVTLPDSVIVISAEAFSFCSNLRLVTLPLALETIETAAFAGCPYLKSPKLPAQLREIGDGAFEGCLRMGALHIPASVEYIGIDAFSGCEKLRLDTSDNKIAEEYAAANMIATRIVSTSGFQFIIIALLTAALGAVVYVAAKKFKTQKRK